MADFETSPSTQERNTVYKPSDPSPQWDILERNTKAILNEKVLKLLSAWHQQGETVLNVGHEEAGLAFDHMQAIHISIGPWHDTSPYPSLSLALTTDSGTIEYTLTDNAQEVLWNSLTENERKMLQFYMTYKDFIQREERRTGDMYPQPVSAFQSEYPSVWANTMALKGR